MSATPLPQVLSLQSSVTFGHVGNSAGVFVMQYRGCNVSPLHCVQLSTEPLYSQGAAGAKFPDDAAANILAKLSLVSDEFRTQQQQQQRCSPAAPAPLFTHALSGYLDSAAKGASLAEFLRGEKAKQGALGGAGCVFLCDPVAGDGGKQYVAQSVPDSIRQHLLPLADITTPNAFECELFSGEAIVDHASALRAAAALHRLGPRCVIVSSYDVSSSAAPAAGSGASNNAAPPAGGGAPSTGFCLLSEAVDARQRFAVFEYRLVDGKFSGTGDLLSALVLSHIATAPQHDMKHVVQVSLEVINRILVDTAQHSPVLGGQVELRIVPNRHLLDVRPPPAASDRPGPTDGDPAVVRVVSEGFLDLQTP